MSDLSNELNTRGAVFSPKSINEKSRTVDVVFSTGAKVLRTSWSGAASWEVLSMDPAHVRMGRLNNGAPFLADHRGALDSVMGVVESARLENGTGIATVRFAAEGVSDSADKLFKLVRDGIVQNISVGYRTYKSEQVEGGDETIPTFRATDWEPYEISMVAMGADDSAGFRSQPTNQPGAAPMHDVKAERERVSGILHAIRSANLDQSIAEKMISDNTSLADARAAALDALAKRNETMPTETNRSPGVGHGALDDRIRTMAEAMAARHGGPAPSEQAKQYMRMTPVDMARNLLEARGVSTRMMSPSQVIATAMNQRGYGSTSDFPALVQELGNRVLRDTYKEFAGGIKEICRPSTARDFRAKNFLQLSEAGLLPTVLQNAELKNFPLTEAKQSYSIETIGGVFSLSRQAIVNDDLGAFADMSRRLARACAQTAASKLAALLTSNPTMPDGFACFSTEHGNYTSTGTAISVASLGVGLKMMRLQKDINNETPVDVKPKYLVVPAAQETLALQYTRTINANQASSVNPWAAALTVVVDPRLDGASTTAWYLAGDPNAVDTIEFSYLDGFEGPQLEMQDGFRVLGTEFRVTMDFGCGVLDHRGLYKNNGA